MNDSEFNQLIEETLIQLEDILEAEDIDYENQSGILTITCSNGTKIIANKHAGMKQLWLATKLNGHHCEWNGSIWADTKTNIDFCQLLQEAIEAQSGRRIAISLELD
jgi:CyaY protein